jgi:hypothetical protein
VDVLPATSEERCEPGSRELVAEYLMRRWLEQQRADAQIQWFWGSDE